MHLARLYFEQGPATAISPTAPDLTILIVKSRTCGNVMSLALPPTRKCASKGVSAALCLRRKADVSGALIPEHRSKKYLI